MAVVVISDLSGSFTAKAETFLPDDAVIACRAILPQCFTRDTWATLCANDPSVAEGHPEACRATGSKQSNPFRGGDEEQPVPGRADRRMSH